MPTQFESLALFGMSRLALTTMVAAAFFYALAYLCSRLLLKLRSPMPYPYPPGPPAPSLILGHFGRLPMKKPWLAYMEMAKTYGDLIYFRSLKEHIIILNSHEAANDLLEKQARFTSDRPFGYALDSYVGWNDVVTLMCYSDRWRKARRTSHQNLSPEAVLKYRIIQVEKVHQFLQRLISSPSSGEIFHLIGRVSQSIMMSAIYGLNLEITSESKQDDTAQAARDIDDFGDRLLLPGGNTYKSIPFIHYLPFIFPFLPFSRMENSAKTTLKALKDEPFEASMKAWASGSSSSLVGQLVSEAKIRYRDEGKSEYLAEIESIKSMGLTALAAAADTTMSAIATFFIAMSLYPQAQNKAQAELDRVLGFGRLPGFGDRTSLPYMEAIYREVMRWHPAVPIGVTHKTTEDILYKGYYIPKGSVVAANIWAMERNPVEHENPGEFIPERHLQDNGSGEPESKSGFGNASNMLAYGFGRRVCVGRYFADATLWCTMAFVLATMNISRDPTNSADESVSDEDLKKNLEDYYTDWSFCHPKELPGVKVVPRLSKEELEGLFVQDKET